MMHYEALKVMEEGDSVMRKTFEEEYTGDNPFNYTPRDTEKRGNGGSTHYYELPDGATELRDLIRHKKMSHPIGEAFAALYRLNDNGEFLRNLEKAKFYIEWEIECYNKENM